MAVMTCHHCGVSSEPDSSFCTQCGRPLEVPHGDVLALRDDLQAMAYRFILARNGNNDPEATLDVARDLANNLAQGLQDSWDFARRVIR